MSKQPPELNCDTLLTELVRWFGWFWWFSTEIEFLKLKWCWFIYVCNVCMECQSIYEPQVDNAQAHCLIRQFVSLSIIHKSNPNIHKMPVGWIDKQNSSTIVAGYKCYSFYRIIKNTCLLSLLQRFDISVKNIFRIETVGIFFW